MNYFLFSLLFIVVLFVLSGKKIKKKNKKIKLVSRAIRILRVEARARKTGGGGKIRMVYFEGFLCVGAECWRNQSECSVI